MAKRDAYYRCARASTFRTREFESEIRYFFKRFERLYPPFRIPTPPLSSAGRPVAVRSPRAVF